MDAQIISGKEIAEEIRGELRGKVAYLKDKGIVPGLGVVLVGDDPASHVYVNNKIKACEELGLKSKAVILPAEVSEEELLKKVDELNADPEIHAFLVQLPLPKHIDENKIINRIDPHKDADAFHPFNVGRMLIGDPIFMPATPHGSGNVNPFGT